MSFELEPETTPAPPDGEWFIDREKLTNIVIDGAVYLDARDVIIFGANGMLTVDVSPFDERGWCEVRTHVGGCPTPVTASVHWTALVA